MKTQYLPRFLKDVKRLKGTPSYAAIVSLAFERFPEAKTLADIPHCKKLSQQGNFYRVRVGDYRIGFRFDGETVTFMRALHRKDIYRRFP